MTRPRPEHDIGKLPKWAAEYIHRLENDLMAAEQALTSEGPVVLNPYSEVARFRSEAARVLFEFPDNRDLYVYREDDHLTISARYGLLFIEPRAANVARLRSGGAW